MYYRKPSLADQEIIRQEIVDFSSDPVNSIQDIQDFVIAKNAGMSIYLGKFENDSYQQTAMTGYYDDMLSLVDWLRTGIIVDGSGAVITFEDFVNIAFTEVGNINQTGETIASISVGD
jgi:hypothetical protein